MKTILSIVLILALIGCATNREINEGERLIASGQPEAGLAMLEQAAHANSSTDTLAYTTWVTQREIVLRGYIRDGDTLRAQGALDDAELSYQRALNVDPSSAAALGGIRAIARERRHFALAQQAQEEFEHGDLVAAERDARLVLAESSNNSIAKSVMKRINEKSAEIKTAPPLLTAALKKSMTLEFRDAPLRSIFEVIARTSNINFVFDHDVRQDLRATIFMRDSNLDEIIRTLLVTNQLDRKILNENSILIYPNTPAKQKEYQEQVVRSFYLANADAKQTATMIRALLKTRDMYVDEKLNLLVIKDTPEAVRVAEELVATQDLGESEVVLEVEVLEVASSLMENFGLRFPDRINFGVLSSSTSSGDGSTSTGGDIALKPRNWEYFVANPALILNLQRTDGGVNLLANPRIRVKNREKARIHIGEKVPVITTTSTANVGVSSSVSYLETGLKLDVEPNIYLENEVSIKVQLEVSNILEQLNISGTLAYRLGTRNAATTLRLHDGETEVLAGLINDEDRRSANKVPYLSDLPILGRLFRNDSDSRIKTEIVLLITPHIVRNLSRPTIVAAQFSAGTDAAPGALPMRLTNAAPGAFNMSSRSGSGNPPVQSAATAAANESVGEGPTLTVDGPAQASLGEEFSLSFGLPARNQGANANVQLSYDPTVLAVVGGARGEAGSALLSVNAPTIAGGPPSMAQARFRVIAKAPTNTQIGIELSNARDSQGHPISIQAPGAHSLSIIGSRGTTIYTPVSPILVPTPKPAAEPGASAPPRKPQDFVEPIDIPGATNTEPKPEASVPPSTPEDFAEPVDIPGVTNTPSGSVPPSSTEPEVPATGGDTAP